ncbi:MBOAT family protein, partial [Klebsiella oxytoca]
LLIAASTVVTWGSGLLIAGCAGKPGWKAVPISKKWCMAGCFGFNLGILFFFKYYGFPSANLKALLRWGGVETLGM